MDCNCKKMHEDVVKGNASGNDSEETQRTENKLKSPPEELISSSVSADTSLLSTAPANTHHVPSLSSLRGQSPNSLVDVLKQQAASPPRKQGGINEEFNLPRTSSTGAVNNNNEGPVVQANLEESYWHGPNSSQTENNIMMDKPDNNIGEIIRDKGDGGSGDNTTGMILEETQQNDNNILQPNSEVEEKEQVKRAMAESRAMSATKPHQSSTTSTESEVIVLDDSDDDNEVDDDRKMPANVDDNTKIKGGSPSLTAGVADTSNNNEQSEESQVEEAIRLSLLEAKEERRATQYYEYGGGSLCRKLTRQEFKDAIDSFVLRQGGYEKLESGSLIKHGNANDMAKSKVAAGGGKNQTSAQYGRYSIDRMWRVFDVLEGKADINIEEEAVSTRRDSEEKEKVEKRRLDGSSGAKIKAFVDIGHGIGIQVLQAGWANSVPARGVEIMKERHLVAESIREGVIESLRNDPPDNTLVELECEDFSKAIVGEDRDEKLRSFLLFKDKSMDVQKGLV